MPSYIVTLLIIFFIVFLILAILCLEIAEMTTDRWIEKRRKDERHRIRKS